MAGEFIEINQVIKTFSALRTEAHREDESWVRLYYYRWTRTASYRCKTCNYLADHNMNILDITQTILQEYFNMMMIVDISGSKTSFDDMAHELDKLGQEIGVKILCQREEIFTSMHRI